MAINYPLTLPASPSFRTMGWRPRSASGMSESPFTLAQQVQRSMGQGWSVQVQLPAMKRDDAAEWAAFLLSLDGRYGTFLLPVEPAARTIRGSLTGLPLADTVGSPSVNFARATQLYLRNLPVLGSPPVGIAGLLKRGDFLSLDDGTRLRLHMALTTLDSNSAGTGVVEIWPRLRGSVSNGAAITYASCQGTFRLAENVGSWNALLGRLYDGFTFTAIEAVP